MLETLFSSTLGESLSIINVLAIVASALILGFLISLAYMLTHRKTGWQQSFVTTLIMLPAIIAIIIMLVGNNVARAFSLAGAFSLIRFRSAPGDPKDIAYVFFTLAVGLACGLGFIGYAALFAVFLCLVMIVIELTNFAAPGRTEMTLRISIPESLNFENAFDDILNEFTKRWVMKKVRTTEFGSLFELVFDIDMKADADRKKFIDKLRVRNGNLPVQLVMRELEERTTM